MIPKRGLAALRDHDRRAGPADQLQDARPAAARSDERQPRRRRAECPADAVAPRATHGATATRHAPAPAATPDPPATAGGCRRRATVDGPVVSTRFGPVQVEIVVADGRISDVVALQLPTGRHSGQISAYAAPILRQEALQAQSASIDIVSGATYTSDAYAQSLQAALDKAGLG